MSRVRAVGAGCLLAFLVAGCALSRTRDDAAEPATRIEPEPAIVMIEASGPRYYEPATTEADLRLQPELAALLAGVEAVERAYLARVGQAEQDGAGVLTVCIVARGPVSDDVVRRIGRAFAVTHGTGGVLDVQELGSAQERALAPGIRPFYGSPLPQETQP